MQIERDEWLYVHTSTAKRAREFFGVPPETEVRLEEESIDGALPCWAVRAPTIEQAPEGPLPLETNTHNRREGVMENRYGIHRAGDKGAWARVNGFREACKLADTQECRSYVVDYAAKAVVYRNWQPLEGPGGNFYVTSTPNTPIIRS